MKFTHQVKHNKFPKPHLRISIDLKKEKKNRLIDESTDRLYLKVTYLWFKTSLLMSSMQKKKKEKKMAFLIKFFY